MENPLISILMPAYNSEAFIQESIDSVKNQTYTNWELIIIDDKSIDNTKEIVKNNCQIDNRIKLYEMEFNSKPAKCRNVGLLHSTGEYIAFLDSDDLWKPEKLKKQLEYMINNDCDFSFTEYDHINEKNEPLKKRAKIIRRLSYKKMLYHCFTGCLTVMYKKNGILTPEVKNTEDYALFLDVLKKVKNAHGIPESMAYYRITNNSFSRNKIKKIKSFYEVFMKYNYLSIFQATFYLITNQVIKLLWKYKKVNRGIRSE